MVFDPATLMFLVGGLAWITIDAGRLNSIRLRWAEWGWTLARFALIVAAWLPIRAIVLLGLYFHRAGVSEWNLPLRIAAMSELNPPPHVLHVMNQFLSPWVLLAMLVPRSCWPGDGCGCWAMLPLPEAQATGRSKPAARRCQGPAGRERRRRLPSSRTPPGRFPSSIWPRPPAACSARFSSPSGLQWEPIGTRKKGRVMIVEKHSPWSPSNPTPPYDTEFIGGGDDEHGSSYNYAAAYQYLSQYYEMSRLDEEDAIDEKTLSACDVLVIKIPRIRYTPEEVRAVVNFVEAGGGLLLIGDHTNLERSAAHMNDITRAFGFTFRDDVLYSNQPSPDQEHYQASDGAASGDRARAGVRLRRLLFDRSGISLGRPVVSAAGLWSMPGDYHYSKLHALCPAHAGNALRLVRPGLVHARRPGTRDRLGRLDHLLELLPLSARQGPGAAEPGRVAQSPRGHGPLVAVDLARTGGDRQRAVAGPPRRFGLAGAGGGRGLRLDPRFDGHRGAAGPGDAAAVAAGRRRRLPQVVIDRTTSQAPLAKGPDNDDRSGRGFGLLEQSISRLGYTTVRAEGDDVFQGDAVVMIYPSRPVSEAFRKRLVEYVAGGGRLLVIDAGLNDVPSTSNQILRPFGLLLDYRAALEGRAGEALAESRGRQCRPRPWRKSKFPPGIYVESAWQVFGGTSVAAVHAKLEKRTPTDADVYADPDDLRHRPVRQGPGHGCQLRQHVQRQEPGQRLVAQSRSGRNGLDTTCSSRSCGAW